MQEEVLYTTGEFAKRANVSVRTIRYYDDKGLLKPSIIKESGYRYYTGSDFIQLQKIIVLKRLGFSLEDISRISNNNKDTSLIKESLDLQLQIIRDKIEELRLMEQCIQEVSHTVASQSFVAWDKIISLIHLVNMQETLEEQYKNSTNIDARIELHRRFSHNAESWFRWIYDNLAVQEGMDILEAGCGNGQLWMDNLGLLPDHTHIVLSDISMGMIRSTKRRLKGKHDLFTFQCFDFINIPYADESFDIVIANHVLFYAKDRDKTLAELHRVLKKGGKLCCSTYGRQHLKEIELLVKEFDNRISLSEVKLYDIFGLENGAQYLSSHFQQVDLLKYDDFLLITELSPLAEYIYSCHGNQLTILDSQRNRFEKYLQNKVGRKGLHVTKDAGIFLCTK